MNEYNFEVYQIWPLLKFWKKDLTEQDLLEKPYSTFHSTKIILQQQYRPQKFVKVSNLTSALLIAEKEN